MSEKQPQILIFNAAGELVAIARSIRSAAELTKVDERINLAIATNSPEALKISICGCFSGILYWAILFPRTKLAIFSHVSLMATTKIKSPPRRLGKIPKNSEMSEGQ